MSSLDNLIAFYAGGLSITINPLQVEVIELDGTNQEVRLIVRGVTRIVAFTDIDQARAFYSQVRQSMSYALRGLA